MKEMNDLISRQAAIDIASGYCHPANIAKELAKLPSAEPEVTRCAECIHWKHSIARKSYCEVFDWMSKAEDFCSYAERRGDTE